jgi:hypothetical protein
MIKSDRLLAGIEALFWCSTQKIPGDQFIIATIEIRSYRSIGIFYQCLKSVLGRREKRHSTAIPHQSGMMPGLPRTP